MKKCKIYLAAILIMAALFTAYKTWSPEYRICRSFSYSCTDYRETELHVIINRPWGVGETIEKIVTQYNKMNGTPDRLVIWCYHNEDDMDQGREFYKAEFECGKDMVTDPPEAY